MKNFTLFSILLLFFLGSVTSFAQTQVWEKATDQDTPVTFNFGTYHTGVNNVTIITPPAHGNFVLKNKSITFWPTAGYVGSDTFSYRLNGEGNPTLQGKINVIGLPCSVPINGSTFTWNHDEGAYRNGTVLTHEITQPAASAGFIMDLYKMDNSFNAKINDIKIAEREIQFQNVGSGVNGINVRFQDGDVYANPIPNIWLIIGSEATPMIRVKISSSGVVSLFGSKASNGPLYPLELFNSNSLKQVTWNSTTINNVIF